jgi:ribose transport system ATP-binding protein
MATRDVEMHTRIGDLASGNRDHAAYGNERRVPLVLRHVSKLFGGQHALHDVDLEVGAGEVHALLGANGSGKSTLIKILAGYHDPESGAEILVSGKPVDPAIAGASHAAGLRFIHQDLGLIDNLDVRENMLLVGDTRAGRDWWLSDRREMATARQLLESYGLDVDPRAPVASLSAAEKSMLAIVRAVGDGVAEDGVLVLDEPTASLPPHEVTRLMTLIEGLKRRGAAVLFVTHRLQEVFRIADTVTVLRDGRRITTEPSGGLTEDRLVELMLGIAPSATVGQSRARGTAVVLEVDGIQGGVVRDAGFTVHEGEILGLTGLVGSGYEAVLGLAFGAGGATGGSVTLDGTRLALNAPSTSIRAGVAFAPADRMRFGAFSDFTLRENLTMPALRATRLTRTMLRRAERADAQEWLRKLTVVPPDTEMRFADLSGGNQQKVVLARWLRCQPRALLIDEPTTGVDAGAKRFIYAELRKAARSGAVVMSSSDVEELCEVCDRVLVFGGGRVRLELSSTVGADALMAATLSASDLVPPQQRGRDDVQYDGCEDRPSNGGGKA